MIMLYKLLGKLMLYFKTFSLTRVLLKLIFIINKGHKAKIKNDSTICCYQVSSITYRLSVH